MTAILDIYDAIAALPVKVGSVTPTVRNIDGLKNVLKSADAPVRMLLLATGDRTEASDFGFIALGKLVKAVWIITDRLLWKPASQGAGIEDVSEDLIKYIDAYMEEIRDNRQLTTQSHIVDARFIPGVFDWPPGSGDVFYFGVEVLLTVEDFISGS